MELAISDAKGACFNNSATETPLPNKRSEENEVFEYSGQR